jgi:hypothetical protein
MLRLRRQFDEHQSSTAHLLANYDLTVAELQAATWEQLAARALKKGDLLELSQNIRRRGSHYLPTYICEGRLLQWASNQKRYIENSPSFTTLRNDREMKIHLAEACYAALWSLERANDSSNLLTKRMEFACDAVSDRHLLDSVEQELLVLAATSRFLFREGHENLCSMVINEYRSLCFRITNGQLADVLGLLQDIFDGLSKDSDPVQFKLAAT